MSTKANIEVELVRRGKYLQQGGSMLVYWQWLTRKITPSAVS
ncbi:MAG TPA: hypothetical protein VIZ87_06215 [Terrimicrobium sp.]